MNYIQRSKPKQKINAKILVIIVVFLLLSLFAFLFPNFLKTFSYQISKPVWKIGSVSKLSVSWFYQFFSFRSTLTNKNLALEDELDSLKLKQVDYDALQEENKNLKEELGRYNSSTKILAAVLSKPPESPYDTLVIDVGSKQGVALGQKVYLSQSIIVGVVTDVTPNTSLVELFSTGNRKQEATLSRTHASFTLTGRGGGNFILEVPKDTDIVWGDEFIYPGLNQSILGSVYYIDSSSQNSFKTIYIRSFTNIFNVDSVFVEKA